MLCMSNVCHICDMRCVNVPPTTTTLICQARIATTCILYIHVTCAQMCVIYVTCAYQMCANITHAYRYVEYVHKLRIYICNMCTSIYHKLYRISMKCQKLQRSVNINRSQVISNIGNSDFLRHFLFESLYAWAMLDVKVPFKTPRK